MKRYWIQTTCLLLAAALAVTAWAAEAPIPPAPRQYVTDTAGFLGPQTVQSLNVRLRAYDQATGHQIVVWIGRSTGDTPLEDWAVKAYEQWQIGRKGIDDGVLLAIMADDRKLRFEVGYGLEGNVPDVVAFRIIDEVMTPRIKAGDRDGAVVAGIDALLGKIGGEKAGAAGRTAEKPNRRVQPHREPPSLGQIILFGIVGIIFLFILITNPSLALYLLWALSSGGRGGHHGGGGGGGGGFSGGGGRSGGGGASGGW